MLIKNYVVKCYEADTIMRGMQGKNHVKQTSGQDDYHEFRHGTTKIVGQQGNA